MEELGGFLLRVGMDAALSWSKVPAAAGSGQLFASFDLDEAIGHLSQSIIEDPANARARFLRGVAFQAQQRYAEALVDLDVVLQHEPNHARAWLLRSEICFALGEHVQGEADRAKALTLDPAIAVKNRPIVLVNGLFPSVHRLSSRGATMRIPITIVTLLFAANMLSAAEPAKRPNILFIYTDDHSHRTVELLSRGVPVGEDAEHRRAGQARRPLHARLHRHLVHAVAGHAADRPASATASSRCAWKASIPAAPTTRSSAASGPRSFATSGYVTAQIGKWHTGTDTGFGRDWDYQIVWNRPKFPDNAAHYYDDQMISINGKPDELVKGYSTDNYTHWAVDFIQRQGPRRRRSRGISGSATAACTARYTPARAAPAGLPRRQGAGAGRHLSRPRPGKPDYVQKMEVWVKGPERRAGAEGRQERQDAARLGPAVPAVRARPR